MDNDKRCTLTVEVPRKQPKFKEVVKDALKEALTKGVIEAGNSLLGSFSRGADDRNTELRIDIPKIQFGSLATEEEEITPDTDTWEVEETKETKELK